MPNCYTRLGQEVQHRTTLSFQRAIDRQHSSHKLATSLRLRTKAQTSRL
jgi:hypothetical protein